MITLCFYEFEGANKNRLACSVLVGKPEGRDHVYNKDTDGNIILKWILKEQDMDLVYLVQGKDYWCALVNVVMNIRFL
jgi:hypothetical protein